MVVEITPLGIQNLQWRFYILWTVLNFSFIPLVYVFYPETAARTLEDMDRYFRENQDPFVFKYKEATAPVRPTAYLEHERQEVRRASSVNPQVLRNMSRVAAMMEKDEEDRMTDLAAREQPMDEVVEKV